MTSASASAVSRSSGIVGQRGVDRERGQHGVLRQAADRDVRRRPAACREIERAQGAARVQVAVGPERHPALEWSRTRRVGDAQRIVPDQRVDVVAEERSVIAKPGRAALVSPLEGSSELGRPRIHRRRQLDGVGKAEGAGPRLTAVLVGVLHLQVDIEAGRGDVGQLEVRDVALEPHLERVRLPGRRRQGRRHALNPALNRVVYPEHTGRRRGVQRQRVLTEEQRNLIPLEGGLDPAELVQRRRILLIPVADMVGGEGEPPRGGVVRQPEGIQRDPIPHVAIALIARLVGSVRIRRSPDSHVEEVRGGDVGQRRVRWSGGGCGRLGRGRGRHLLREHPSRRQRDRHDQQRLSAETHGDGLSGETRCRRGCWNRGSGCGSSRSSGR